LTEFKTVAGNIGGTLPYMSPEQIRAFAGQGYSDVGPLTDVYGLGATMYELLTGKMPFGTVPADDGLRILLEMRKEKPESIRKYNPSVDPDLERLVMSCLAYEMPARPVSAQVVADELDFIRKRTMVRGVPSDWLGTRGLLGTTAVLALLMPVAIGPLTANAISPIPENNVTLPNKVNAKVIVKTNAELAVEKAAEAYAALESEQTEKAVDLFEQARQLDGRNEGAQRGYVRALVAVREFKAASKELNALVEKRLRIPEIDAMHSYCLAVNRHYKQAIDYDNRVQAQGLRTPELLSNRAYMLTQANRAKEGIVVANQALQQMGRPSRTNMVVAISILKSDTSRKSWDAEVLTNLMSGTPDSAAKYELFSYVSVLLAVKAKLEKDAATYELFSESAVNTLLQGTREFGVPETYYTNIKNSGLSPRQAERVQDEGLFPNASDPLIEKGSDPSPYLFDPIEGSKYERACQRKLKDIQ
jgi:tetratricopeptide (TPR) repeat protein